MSKIEWTDETLNCITGCTKVSAGCKNCYAEKMYKRLNAMGSANYQHTFNQVRCFPEVLDKVSKWRKPRMVFVNSMSDTFHGHISLDFIARMYITFRQNPQHTFLLLTKRPERALEFYQWNEERTKNGPWSVETDLPNVWIGTSVEDQATADERIPYLLQIPAAKRFLSVEPMLGEIDLTRIKVCDRDDISGPHPYMLDIVNGTSFVPIGKGDIEYGGSPKINWVICGGESGPGARQLDVRWIELLRDQCVKNDIPFFLKQWKAFGKMVKMPELDGRIWDQVPEIK